MPNTPQLSPVNQFPQPAIQESVQVQPDPNSTFIGNWFTIAVASVADNISPWGKNVEVRDRQLRDFWPTESYLAGAVANVSFRNAAFDWEIRHPSRAVEKAVTDMIRTAIAGDKIGWGDFAKRFSQDLYCCDNGAFIELVRDPGMDANSKFKGAMAPVIGIVNLDSGQCTRTGNPQYPVIYKDRDSQLHKLKWYEVIPFSEYPSAIERMNGVGYSAITRCLRLAQIMRSIEIFKDEEVGGRNTKKINVVGGVGLNQINDALVRAQEHADNRGTIRYIDHAILASLDPEKPVSLVTIDLASLPEGFNFDQEMQWYISGLALGFGVDYQEFAPLPGGNIGSGSQSNMLHRKSSGKGPRNWMNAIVEGFTNYGVLPRGAEMIFNDKNEQEELEKQEIRTKASEEAAIIVNAKIFPPEVVAQSLIRRGIYDKEDFENTPPEWWKLAMQTAENEAKKQPVGERGGNTLAEDAKRQDTGKPNPGGARLRKELEEVTFLGNLKNLLQKVISRSDTPVQPPNVNVTVNNEPGKPPRVFFKQAPTIVTPAKVTVNVPKQEAPVVNFKQAAPPPSNITVNVPEQKQPIVNVNVPNQPPPKVEVRNVNTIQMPEPKPVKVVRKNGEVVRLEQDD